VQELSGIIELNTQDNKIIIYQSQDGNIFVDTIIKAETIWLTQEKMALLFG